jgi:hypothetical protein
VFVTEEPKNTDVEVNNGAPRTLSAFFENNKSELRETILDEVDEFDIENLYSDETLDYAENWVNNFSLKLDNVATLLRFSTDTQDFPYAITEPIEQLQEEINRFMKVGYINMDIIVLNNYVSSFQKTMQTYAMGDTSLDPQNYMHKYQDTLMQLRPIGAALERVVGGNSVPIIEDREVILMYY